MKLILFLTILFLSSCSTKTHVITEMDGDREVRWYSEDDSRSK